MSGTIPHTALMTAALAMAESEGVPLGQTQLRETSEILDAALCPEDDCLLPRGHDCDCLPTLVRFAEDRQKLAEALDSMLSVHSDGPLSETCRDTLRVHGADS